MYISKGFHRFQGAVTLSDLSRRLNREWEITALPKNLGQHLTLQGMSAHLVVDTRDCSSWTLQKSLRAGMSEEIQPYWTFRPNFPWQKKFPLKIKSSDMQNQIIIIIMRWFPQIITYSKIRRTVLAHKICSLQVFQSSVFFQETAHFLWIVAAGFLQR